jgi:hypothetical protein
MASGMRPVSRQSVQLFCHPLSLYERLLEKIHPNAGHGKVKKEDMPFKEHNS